MKLRALGLFLLLLFSIQLTALAEPFRRTISLEWESIEDAKTYEVQIQAVGSKQEPLSFTVKDPSWAGSLELGKYTLRVRARDHRKVPGDWSDPSEFAVALESVKPITPSKDQHVLSTDNSREEIHFVWEKLPGADSYNLIIRNEEGQVLETKKTDKTNFNMRLPVAANYEWEITGISESGYNSPNPTVEHFTIVGAKLAKPKLKQPENPFVRHVGWEPPPLAEGFDYLVTRWDPKDHKWKPQEKKVNSRDNQLPFASQWPGGKYKVSVRATAKLRQSSGVAEISFDVAKGSRSPAAEETAMARESFDHTTGWFGMASYLVTMMNYQGANSDLTGGTSVTNSFSGAIGGTGRLGIGRLSDKSKWGFLLVGDYSGISINSSILNYGSLETNAMYRTLAGQRGELRQQLGAFFKQYPNIQPNSDGLNATENVVGAVGPHYGIEYWYGMTRKLGLQANGHIYYNMSGVGIPNGGSIISTPSFQLGFLGSYRLTQKATGLVGYAYRLDSVSYTPTIGSTPNTSSITGNYINFVLEWQL